MNLLEQINRHPMWRGFVKSNYITALWNWFLGLAGKAAEPVLFASVLYSGYELVPGVPQPTPGVNAVAFVIQQAALDVGGMGLIKLTKDEDPEKFKFARKIGVALITLMVVNMVVATSGRVFQIPPNIMQFTEGVLLIIRSVMAVLFGHAIHTLKDDSLEQKEEIDIAQIVNQAVLSEVQNIRSFYEAKIADLEQSLSGLQSDFLASQERTSEENTEPIAVQEIVQSQEVEQPQESTAPNAPASPARIAKSPAPKVQTSEAVKRARKLLKKDPTLTAKELAGKIEKSESYAQKLKAQIAKESAEPKPRETDQLQPRQSEQHTDPLPAQNGHRKVTQPLELVEMEI